MYKPYYDQFISSKIRVGDHIPTLGYIEHFFTKDGNSDCSSFKNVYYFTTRNGEGAINIDWFYNTAVRIKNDLPLSIRIKDNKVESYTFSQNNTRYSGPIFSSIALKGIRTRWMLSTDDRSYWTYEPYAPYDYLCDLVDELDRTENMILLTLRKIHANGWLDIKTAKTALQDCDMSDLALELGNALS